MYHILRDDEYVASAATVQDAVAFCEDDAVQVWDQVRDPNAATMQLYPGIQWSMGLTHLDEGTLEIGKGCVKYGIIDPMPFYTWAIDYDHETGQQFCLVVYDNQACDYPHPTESVIWL